jgi:hypothetical protein
MQCCKTLTIVFGVCWFLAVGEQNARSQEKPASGTVQVHVSRNLAWGLSQIADESVDECFEDYIVLVE